jgi:hypothetical protein
LRKRPRANRQCRPFASSRLHPRSSALIRRACDFESDFDFSAAKACNEERNNNEAIPEVRTQKTAALLNLHHFLLFRRR